MLTRKAGRAGAVVLLWMLISLAAAASGQTRREDLVGAWRLVRIEVEGPQGAGMDPFYGSGSQGLMIYDRAGWFSVQIMGSDRPALDVPAHRPDQGDPARQVRQAAALDTYYAYYGTWTFDVSSSTVTHHARGALYPAEQDATYAQHVEVHDTHMVFSRTQIANGQRTTQRKVWERVSAP